MNSSTEQWAVKDRKGVLLAMMEALAGEAHLSLEGDLRRFALTRIAGASEQETASLKRSTRWPQQDFIVLPLESATIKTVMAAIGGSVPRRILHVQIERRGNLEFAAYEVPTRLCVLWTCCQPRSDCWSCG